ncbi:MAG: hypothetical protein ACYTKD_08635 [Planctomycetota bacterium]|jgi:hypothetical protein
MRGTLALVCGVLAAGVAAGGTQPVEYRSEATIGLGDVEEDFELRLGYRFYSKPVRNDGTPIFLQPFLQRASFAQGTFTDGPNDESLFSVDGRFVFPDTPVGLDVGFGFGDATKTADQSFFAIGGIVYLTPDSDFAAEVSIDFFEIANVDVTNFQIGVRAVPGNMDKRVELALAYKSVEVDDGGDDESGVVGDVIFYPGKRAFVGARFDSVDPVDRFVGTAGYSFGEALDVVLEIGGEEDEFLLRGTATYRF